MDKKRLIVSYSNVSAELLEAIKSKYPLGFSNHVIKVKTKGDDFFYAITVDTEDASYLVKVPVKIDTKGISDDDSLGDMNDEKESDDSYSSDEPSAEPED